MLLARILLLFSPWPLKALTADTNPSGLQVALSATRGLVQLPGSFFFFFNLLKTKAIVILYCSTLWGVFDVFTRALWLSVRPFLQSSRVSHNHSLWLLCFWIESHHIVSWPRPLYGVHMGPKLTMILLPSPLECWDYRYEQRYSVHIYICTSPWTPSQCGPEPISITWSLFKFLASHLYHP